VGSLPGSRRWEGGFYPPQPSLELVWGTGKKEGLLPLVSQGWLWIKEICGPALGTKPSFFDASGYHMGFVGVFFPLSNDLTIPCSSYNPS